MFELTVKNTNIKMPGKIIASINYGNNPYCIYSAKRSKEEDNIFVSKIVKNSQGYTLDDNFTGGEKEALDNVINSILNKESLDSLKELGVEFIDLKPSGINVFDEKKCYVTTYNSSLLEECLLNYNLVKIENKPIVKMKKSKPVNKGNIGSIALIIFGLLTIIICLIMIINYLI